MRLSFIRASALFTLAAASMLAPRPAHACGGCFHQPAPTQTTVVTGHRMAFSISPKQSVLWDQIQYSGSPKDFAWVLPVRPGATVQASHDEFFAALDAMTNPVITGPTPNCGNGGGGGGFGCGSGSSSASGAFSPTSDNGGSEGGNGVQVLSEGVVGPYDQVTVRSTNPNALYSWLTANGYEIPTSIRPVIDAYVSGGFDFIALRLAPGEGVQAMTPVRVVTPGAGLSLPLRMVAAGVGANVGITLYVVSGGRYQTQNFPSGTVDDSKLVWLHAQGTSNYVSLAQAVMSGSGGRTWLTDFAQNTDLQTTASMVSAEGAYSCGASGAGGQSVNVSGSTGLPDLYYAQCLCVAGGQVPQGSDAGGDAGSEPCAGFDDLEVAGVGLDPGSTWVTRMRALLPASALAAGDLVLEAAPSQTPVNSQLRVSVYDDPTYQGCTGASSGGGNGSPGGSGSSCSSTYASPLLSERVLVVGTLGLLGIVVVRRRRLRG